MARGEDDRLPMFNKMQDWKTICLTFLKALDLSNHVREGPREALKSRFMPGDSSEGSERQRRTRISMRECIELRCSNRMQSRIAARNASISFSLFSFFCLQLVALRFQDRISKMQVFSL